MLALAAFALAADAPAGAQTAPTPQMGPSSSIDMPERYARAEAMLDSNRTPLVLNETVSQHWTGRGAEFWYRHQRADGGEYVVVDDAGKTRTAFDHARLAAVVSSATKQTVGNWALDLTSLIPETRATARVGELQAVCDLANYACSVVAVPATDRSLLISPSGPKAAFARDSDLWLRDFTTGVEKRLTQDGEPFYEWGKYPDAGLLAVTRQRSGLNFPPWGYAWSPDGRFLIGGRLDERNVEPYPFVESVPQDGSFRPKLYWVRQALLGERGPRFELSAFDTTTGGRAAVALPAEKGTATTALAFDILGWNAVGTRFYGVQPTDYRREMRLLEIDPATGKVRTMLVERAPKQMRLNPLVTNNAPNARIIKGGREVIWYSERSGSGHLYRYETATGRFLGTLTRGDWLVRDIVHVDEANARIYFTGGGREPGNPYHRKLYRVGFDGSDLTLLTPEDADHMFDGAPIPAFAALFGAPVPPTSVSPDGSVFVGSYSTLDAPPVTLLRSTKDGRVIATLEKADASKLYATGWRPPEPFVAKAADGKTDLYGVINWPEHRGNKQMPVIDALYAGPQVAIVPHNFPNAHGGRSQAALAELGFAVVTVDGRGTPLRSKAFQDVSYGNYADPALDDHVVVLRELAKRYPEMDLERVGVFGHSLGGYVSARAMLRFPDFYKVGVSSAGSHNYQAMYDVSTYLYAPDYGDGATAKPSPTAIPENYRDLDNASLAANLTGKLLLAYGDMDENAYAAVTFQFIDALIKANRDYDLLYLPNRTHGFGSDRYFIRRRWDYFVEHLMGTETSDNYQIKAPLELKK